MTMSDPRNAASPQEFMYEQTFICHEWEELVERLSTSHDPKLREIGLLEQEFLKMRRSPLKAA